MKELAAEGAVCPDCGNAPALDESQSAFAPLLKPGQSFGSRYRIDAYIGQGGMGQVYKAYDIDLDRVIALKIIRPDLAADPASLQRFKKEILLASAVSHPNILRIHDLGDIGGVKFISMVYVEGEDLAACIHHSKRLPISQAIDIGLQLCAALDAAHRAGVVHRDLKPKNILIDRTGAVFVSDFGLAKSLERDAPGVTRTGDMIGTPLYMSPEQVESSAADHRSDIYALGLILYEMVTGEVPFRGNSTLHTMYRRLKERPKEPRILNPDVSDGLAHLILRCLEKEPAKRYQSGHDMADVLVRERGRPPQRPVMWRLRRWRMLVVPAMLALGMAILLPTLRHFGPPTHASVSSHRSSEKYIAFLPLQVLGSDEISKYQAQGITESMEAKLFPLRQVHMASPPAVEQARSKGSVQQIAKKLGVRFIVDGTFQRVEERLRIIIKLHDVTAGRILWEKEFSGFVQDLLTIEDQIFQQLISELHLETGPDEMVHLSFRPTGNIDAYEEYLKGRSAIRGSRDPAELKRGLEYFKQAIAKDPSFALAHAGVADSYVILYELTKDRGYAERALAAARDAQILNDNLPEVHFALGSANAVTGRSAEATSELRRAVQLAPNSDEGWRRLGTAYAAMGKHLEAIQAFERAVAANSFYWPNYNQLGAAYFLAGDNSKAAEAFQHIIELEPDRDTGYINLGMAQYREGQWEQAIQRFQKALTIKPSFAVYTDLGLVYFYSGRYEDAVEAHAKALALKPNAALAMANLADDYRQSGDTSRAAGFYQRAIAGANEDLQVNPRDTGTMKLLGETYAKLGQVHQGREYIRRARSIDPGQVGLIYSTGLIEALAGNKDLALENLRDALRHGFPWHQAQAEPDFKLLRDEPGYKSLLSGYVSGRK
jgi:serine/threonine protein kinase/tetratricopeptide (TPR) repeat protein